MKAVAEERRLTNFKRNLIVAVRLQKNKESVDIPCQMRYTVIAVTQKNSNKKSSEKVKNLDN